MIEEILNNKNQPIIDYSNFEFSSLGDAAAFGGYMVLLGMATIFAVLCLLWGFLVLFKIVFHDLPEKKAREAVENTKAIVDEAVPAPETKSDDGELIAVIAAAIAMAESESQGMKFKVVSFKRI